MATDTIEPTQSPEDVPADICHFKEDTRFKPFDPVELAQTTAKAVCKGDLRKYSRFGYTPDYKLGIATGYHYGCCLRCIFCWASAVRDKPHDPAQFLSPADVLENLERVCVEKRTPLARISEGEPTLGKEHLVGLLELVDKSDIVKRFYLETNGALLGADEEFVRELKRFEKLWVRVGLKAGTPEMWKLKTGCTAESFHLPFEAVRLLRKHDHNLMVAAMSRDPRIMSPEERVMLIAELAKIHPEVVLRLDEEVLGFPIDTMRRMKLAGFHHSRRPRIFGLWKYIQRPYKPMSNLGENRFSLTSTLKAIREAINGI